MKYPTPEHYQLNAIFNTVGGNHPIDNTDLDQINRVLKRQFDLINEEFTEMVEKGINMRDLHEIRDGLGDTLVTVDGLYFRLGMEYPRVQLWDDFTGFDHVDGVYSIEESLIMLKKMINGEVGQVNTSQVLNFIKVMADGIVHGVYMLAHQWDIDLAADQRAIIAANMSKFDTDEDTAIEGVAKYAALEVKNELFPNVVDGVTYYVIRCVETTIGTDGKAYANGKILKSVNFHEPKLEPLPEGHKLLSFEFATFSREEGDSYLRQR